MKETALGQQWFAAANQALQQPASITIPYKEQGYFAAEKPRAVGLRFTAKRGQKVTIQLSKRSNQTFTLYAEVWNATPKPSLKTAFDTTAQNISFEADVENEYILRLQPELLCSGEYTVSIVAGASLGFPVAGTSARIASIWGDARDAGARRHEGIDIFAPKHTPAIAAADGYITGVNENKLGGKAVWLRAKGKDYVLYYAHLDSQLVQTHQQVHRGDTIGLVGNTGNARTTPPHLHFGVYTNNGAINPLPFVDPASKAPAAITAELFQTPIRLKEAVSLTTDSAKRALRMSTVMLPLAVSASTYRVQLPDGTFGWIPVKSVQSAGTSIRNAVLRVSSFLLERPHATALRKEALIPQMSIKVMGYYNDFAFVQTSAGSEGWIATWDLK